MLETVITAVADELKEYIPNIYTYKTRVTIGVCIFGFLLGLPMTTNVSIIRMINPMRTTCQLVKCDVVSYIDQS